MIPNERLIARLRQAFLDFGYEQMTMVGLARACGVTRRTLYNYFHNKEEAFRGMLAWCHGIEIAAGFDAGERVLAEGGSALEAIVTIMDVRYGEARRDLGRSPYAVEINYSAFRHCGDVMAQSAVHFQQRLAAFLDGLQRSGLLRLRPDVSTAELAQLLANGARGVNQMLPPEPASSLPKRYRHMFAVILRGCCER